MIANNECSACQILLHRNGFRYPGRLRIGSLPSDAAINIVRILEDMMSSEVITASSLRTYARMFSCLINRRQTDSRLPAVFASLSVQIANIMGNSPEGTEVSKHRARFCMLVLKTLQDRWPPLLWYYSIFLQILRKMGCEIPDDGKCSTHPSNDRSVGASSTTEPLHEALRRQPQCNQASDIPSGSFMAEITAEEADYVAMMESFPFSSFLTDNISGQSNSPFDQAGNA